jgi:hypothetical protein
LALLPYYSYFPELSLSWQPVRDYPTVAFAFGIFILIILLLNQTIYLSTFARQQRAGAELPAAIPSGDWKDRGTYQG